MNLKIDETGKNGTLYLKEKLTIERIEDIKKDLQQAMGSLNNLIIDHSEAKEFDLAYLQLLYSCFKTAKETQKQFTVISSRGFLAVVEAAGLPEPEFFSYKEF